MTCAHLPHGRRDDARHDGHVRAVLERPEVGELARLGVAARVVAQEAPRGRQAESALLDSGVVTNRNSVPNDPNGAWYTSGVRLGTPALTTRGFTTSDMDAVADLIAGVLRHAKPTTTSKGEPSKAKYDLSDDVRQSTLDGAAALVGAHPLYPGLEL